MRTFLVIVALVAVALLATSWLQKRDEDAASQEQAEETDRTGIAAATEHGLYDCSCDYLTDTDLTGTERVRVCATDAATAVQVGRGCAVTFSPGSVNKCTCVLWSKVDCPQNDCRQNR